MGEKKKKFIELMTKLILNNKEMLEKIERLRKYSNMTTGYLKDFREDYDKRELRYHERMKALEEQIKEMEKKIWAIEKWEEEKSKK